MLCVKATTSTLTSFAKAPPLNEQRRIWRANARVCAPLSSLPLVLHFTMATTTLSARDQTEPILKDNPRRFVLFPIQYPAVWEMYKKAEVRRRHGRTCDAFSRERAGARAVSLLKCVHEDVFSVLSKFERHWRAARRCAQGHRRETWPRVSNRNVRIRR